MENQVIADGIRQFAQNAGGGFDKVGDVLFQVAFPGERNAALVGIEVLGMAISYSTYCWVLPDPSVAGTLLMDNWGGVDGTCFYLSVNVQEGNAWLILETKQFVGSNPTPDRVASLLGLCRLQWLQANDAMEKAFGVT
jgi:hypothetical protein